MGGLYLPSLCGRRAPAICPLSVAPWRCSAQPIENLGAWIEPEGRISGTGDEPPIFADVIALGMQVGVIVIGRRRERARFGLPLVALFSFSRLPRATLLRGLIRLVPRAAGIDLEFQDG